MRSLWFHVAPTFAALVCAATVAAATELPPAEYKPLPVLTRLVYDNFECTVTRSEGFETTCRVVRGGTFQLLGHFFYHGPMIKAGYLSALTTLRPGAGDAHKYTHSVTGLRIDDENASNLEALWPLKIGNAVEYDYELLTQAYTGATEVRVRATVRVSGEETIGEIITYRGVSHRTFVIEEEARLSIVGRVSRYKRTWWFDPALGVVVKVRVRWTQGADSGLTSESVLRLVEFPPGQDAVAAAAAPAEEQDAAGAAPQAESERLRPLTGAEQQRLVAERATLEAQKAGFEKLAAERAAFEQAKAELAQLAAAQAAARAAAEAAAGKAAEATAEAAAKPAIAPELAGLDFGRYHALVIGNNSYAAFPALGTAVADARAVAETLRGLYGFEVTLLTDASRADVFAAFSALRRRLTWDDNLLIYYAGHGWLDESTGRGYWLPVDSESDNQANWLSNTDITDMLKALQAKHVMVVADSCFSGTLTRGANPALRGADYFQRIVQKRARTVLTSGGLEPVADAGGGGHSVFAKAFLDALEGNRGVLDGTELFSQIRRPVVLAAPQTPEYSDMRFAGHDGGDFVFVRQ